MADISGYIEQIEVAVRGEDVRDAIVDSLNGMNNSIAPSIAEAVRPVIGSELAAAKASGEFDGPKGDDGADGMSPVVTVTTITKGHQVTIIDAAHPSGQSFNVMDGEDAGLTFDETPTRNSTNPVTSHGIFTALQNLEPSSDLPAWNCGDDGKTLGIDNGNLCWMEVSSLPAYGTSEIGMALVVNSCAELSWMDVLPSFDSNDTGRVLTVIDSQGEPDLSWEPVEALPPWDRTDEGKSLVVAHNGGLDWRASAEVPSYSCADVGKALVVGSSRLVWQEVSGLPSYENSDIGKALMLEYGYGGVIPLWSSYLPDYNSTDSGKTLSVDYHGELYWAAFPGLPEYSGDDAGKSLVVDPLGELAWSAAGGLPAYSNEDEGKALVVDGYGNLDWSNAGGLPAYGCGDEGCILMVTAGCGDLELAWIRQLSIPEYDNQDCGKVLSIDENGELTWISLDS